jgi:hypothetical protein
MTDPMTPEELLEELSHREGRFETYADLERALSDVMREHHDRLPARVSAGDVLHYAAGHDLVRREGGHLVVHLAAHQAASVA